MILYMFDNLNQILLALGVAVVIYLICAGRLGDVIGAKKENFCPGERCHGYCCDQIKKEAELHKQITEQYPCVREYKSLGYDNPYIYPYNYNWNQNSGLDPKFKYPGWVRQLKQDLSDDDAGKGNQFPGYMI